MTSRLRRRRTEPGNADRGATIIEFALVLPFLLLLGLGTVEMGMGWVAHDRVETAAAQGARVAAVSGNRVETDRDVLVTLQAALTAEALANLDRVVVFKSTDAAGAVPSGCIKAAADSSQVGVTGACNTYTGATARAASAVAMTGFGGGPSDLDRYWKPAQRNATLAGPPDYVGVWVRTTHNAVTGGFFGDITLQKVTIFRIQPDIDG
ncbi:MAG: TadE/TadG family type IV pilus assembly protein [Acidimicrobiales bacterium]